MNRIVLPAKRNGEYWDCEDETGKLLFRHPGSGGVPWEFSDPNYRYFWLDPETYRKFIAEFSKSHLGLTAYRSVFDRTEVPI